MKVQIDKDTALFVEFQVIPQKKNRNHSTRCEIFEGSKLLSKSQIAEMGDKNHSHRTAVSTGHAFCSPKDKYNKATGKAKALARALNNLYNRPEDRSIRLKIWERFYKLLQTDDIVYLKGQHKYAV